MRISIFGMGYVGAVCAACMAHRGHTIVGVDVSQQKVAMVNAGKSPIVEPGLDELLAAGKAAGRISATTNYMDAIYNTDITFLAVPTPSMKNGDLNLEYIEAVCREVGMALRDKPTRHTVIVRSTVLPGTVLKVVKPILEDCAQKKAGVDFGLGINPEFLRESTAIRDYDEPPMTVVGAYDDETARLMELLYSDLSAPFICKPIEIAEMIKYTCNVWHATKVAFANEIGSIAKAVGVDGREVMDVVCRDQKLNISRYYMKPGFAFGGSCLPKDVRALNYRASKLDVKTPLISSIMPSNEYQVRRAFEIIEGLGKRRIGMLGLSFKAETDDLRESPLVELAEMLIGKGYQLSIYDRNVSFASVHGANKDYIHGKIPHVSSLLASDEQQLLEQCDVLVLGNQDKSFLSMLERWPQDKFLVDLAGFMTAPSDTNKQGICW